MERFIIEIYRAKDDRFLGPLTTAQVIAVGFIVAGVALMSWRKSTGPGKPGIYSEELPSHS